MTDITRISRSTITFPAASSYTIITIEATHLGWSYSNTGSATWCKVTKLDDSHIAVSVYANTSTSTRRGSFNIISGDDMDDVEEIVVEQSCKFNAENLILPQKQEDSIGCAATCAAMCVYQTQAQFKKDGLSIRIADWDEIAKTYGYNCVEDKSPSLKTVYDSLKEGYPILVQVHYGTKDMNPHWVTVYKYTGTSTNGSNLNVEDFMCADPYFGDKRKLNKAANFNAASPVNWTFVYKIKSEF